MSLSEIWKPTCPGSLWLFLIWRTKETDMPRVWLPFWGTLPYWRNGLAEDPWTKANTKSCMGQGTRRDGRRKWITRAMAQDSDWLTDWLGNRSAERDMRSDTAQNVHQSSLIVMKDNLMYSCINQSIASRLKEVIPLCWVLARLHLEHIFHYWALTINIVFALSSK